MGKDYLVRGAKLICICGSELSHLKVARKKVCTSGKKEKANCKDCKECKNIPYFGECKLNTATHTCEGFMDLAEQWQNTAVSLKKSEKINGEEALTMDCVLICKKGGLILPLTSGQGYDDKIDIKAFLNRFQRALLWALGKNLQCNAFGGDPINMNTGNYIYEKEDLVIPGRTTLSFRIFYNAFDIGNAEVLGEGWRHNQEWRVQEDSETGLVNLCTGEGRIIPYRKTIGEAYLPLFGDGGLLAGEPEGYRYCDRDSTEYIFDIEGKLLKKRDREGNQDDYIYNAKGQLTEVHGANGGKLFYEYNGEGRLIRVKDHSERKTVIFYKYEKLYQLINSCGFLFTYFYNENGKLESILRPDGIQALKDEYDSLNRVVKQTMPDGGVTEIEYDSDNRKTYLMQPNGSMVVYESDERLRNVKTIYEDGEEIYEYNDKNLRSRCVDKLGNEMSYLYDEKGNLTEIRDSMGNTVSMAYDEKNRLLYKKTPEGTVLKNIYDKNGLLTETRDAGGNVKKFCYDPYSRPVKITLEDDSELLIAYDKKGNITEVSSAQGNYAYEYDQLNRVTAAWDGNGNPTRFSYDNHNDMVCSENTLGDKKMFRRDFNGKIVEVTDYDGKGVSVQYGLSNKAEAVTDKEGNVTKYAYDHMGNLTEKISPDGSKESYVYDKNNRVTEYKDARGCVTKYEYDANGNRTSIMYDDGAVTSFTYDALNRITEKTESDGVKTCYEYNWRGQITKIIHPGDLTEEMVYDALGRITEHKDIYGNCRVTSYNAIGRPLSVTEGNGLRTEYEYYPGGNLKKVSFPDGTWEEFCYDGSGNVTERTDQGGYTLFYAYDPLDRVTEITSNLGESIAYQYDSVGNMIKVRDGNGNIRKFEYSPMGKICSVLEPDGGKSIYDYDCMGRLTSIKQKDKATLFERAGGNLSVLTDALGNQVTFQYDCYGRTIYQKDGEGYETSFAYDASGNLKSVDYAGEKRVEYEYNALGYLVKIKDWLGTTFINPDKFGRAVSVTDYKNQKVEFEYGTMGEKTAVTYPGGKRVEYKYDKNMRLGEVHTEDSQVTYSYDKNGRLRKKEFPGNVKTEYEYDPAGRITKIVNSDYRDVLDMWEFSYDPAGNRASMKKMRQGIPESGGWYGYSYDSCNRLTEVEKDGRRIRSYTYDVFGNRTSMEQEGEESRYTYNPLNQLISVQGSVDREYAYDKRGNLTEFFENGEKIAAYVYDGTNRVFCYQSGDTMVKYLYNGMGQRVGAEKRISREAGGDVVTRTDYVPDLTRGYHNMLQEKREEAGRDLCIKNYLWDEGLLGVDRGKFCQFVLRDEMATPVRLFYGNGKMEENNDYDEFGNLQDGIWDGILPFGFTGYYKDSFTGNYFAQAREYLPKEGRFAAKDAFGGSLGIPESFNGFSYCYCNPLRYWDPLGYYTVKEGDEAHRLLQAEFKRRFPGDTEHRVENYPNSDSGIGYIDFFLEDNGQEECEVYELKPNSQVLNLDKETNGVGQREGYIFALEETAKRNHEEIAINKRGTTFDPHGWTIPSKIHQGVNIRYYTYYFFKPGMIYWGYVNQPGVSNKKKKAQEKNSEVFYASEVWEKVLDKVSMEGGAGWAALGIIITILVLIASHGTVALPLFASVDCKNG